MAGHKDLGGPAGHVVMGNPDKKGPCLHCQHCGESFPIPTGAIEWFSGVADAFTRVHQDCKPGTKRDHRLCDLQNIIVEDLLP